jgi:hypothetical protein
VVPDDGHPIQGSPGPGTGRPTPAAALDTPEVNPQTGARQGEDAPVWPWTVGATVVVGAGAGGALRFTKGGRP